MSQILLSICIPTLNREQYIEETIESIVNQLEDEVEVVIVDGGSIDNTENIVKEHQKRYKNIKYFKSEDKQNDPSSKGFDQDCSRAVDFARGKYCWLMTDDDLLLPGALARVINELKNGYGLIIANAEVCTNDMGQVLVKKQLNLVDDRIFKVFEWQKCISYIAKHLTFVGAVIIKRQLWQNRNKDKYYGTGFVHVGVILQEPVNEDVLVTASPLVSIRYGNAQWSTRAFKIWMFDWPELIWSFSSLSDDTKRNICPSREPWKNPRKLLVMRAWGRYSIEEYKLYIKNQKYSFAKKFLAISIALFPSNILHTIILYYVRFRAPHMPLLLFELENK